MRRVLCRPALASLAIADFTAACSAWLPIIAVHQSPCQRPPFRFSEMLAGAFIGWAMLRKLSLKPVAHILMHRSKFLSYLRVGKDVHWSWCPELWLDMKHRVAEIFEILSCARIRWGNIFNVLPRPAMPSHVT